MSTKKIVLIALTLPFAAVTAYALAKVGYVGIFAYHLPSPAGWQVFSDLVIALIMICSWMIVDARRTGRNVWPYLVATLLLGSFGPIAYVLLAREAASPAGGKPAASV